MKHTKALPVPQEEFGSAREPAEAAPAHQGAEAANSRFVLIDG